MNDPKWRKVHNLSAIVTAAAMLLIFAVGIILGLILARVVAMRDLAMARKEMEMAEAEVLKITVMEVHHHDVDIPKEYLRPPGFEVRASLDYDPTEVLRWLRGHPEVLVQPYDSILKMWRIRDADEEGTDGEPGGSEHQVDRPRPGALPGEGQKPGQG